MESNAWCPRPGHDLVGANTVGAREDDRRLPSVFLRGVTVPGDRFKSAADDRVIVVEIPVRMRRLARQPKQRNAIRTLLSGKDHWFRMRCAGERGGVGNNHLT
jgi:hypothetical protein